MTERIIDISDGPAGLRVKLGQLLIRREEGEASIPLTDIAVLVVSHPAVTFSQAVLAGLCEAGGSFVLCNGKRMPTGMLLPLEGNYIQTERFRAQAQASLPMKKQLWKQLVRAKVLAQGRVLVLIRGTDSGLPNLAMKVRSGDPANVEAQASRRYWPALLGKGFRRDRDAEDINRYLNYGYGVLRAMVARAVCTAGLHPSLGLHHHNRYDTFCLASDLMEPFRPLVDGATAKYLDRRGKAVPLDKEGKAEVLRVLVSDRLMVEGESRTLFDLLARTAHSLAEVFGGTKNKLFIPEL